MSDGGTSSPRDDMAPAPFVERRGPNRPQGDPRLPAHIMAAVRETIRAAAATCVDQSQLEAAGPYEWLAIVEEHDPELSGLLHSYIESCRYLDELQNRSIDVGHTRRADAIRDATFAREAIRRSLGEGIRRKGTADGRRQ